jgi:Arc/MetJ-type ribon-helix-helix transcriptional regulator
MAYTETSHYDTIIRRHIDSGRASNKTEVIHQALTLLDAVTRCKGPGGAGFTNASELEELLLAGLASGPAKPMTAERKAKIYGRLKR